MKLVSGNAIGHFLRCHHNGWCAQLFKSSSSMSNSGSHTEPLKSTNQFAQKRLYYLINTLAMFNHIALILEWIDIGYVSTTAILKPNIQPLPLITTIILHHNINGIKPFIKLQYNVQVPNNLYSTHLNHSQIKIELPIFHERCNMSKIEWNQNQ